MVAALRGCERANAPEARAVVLTCLIATFFITLVLLLRSGCCHGHTTKAVNRFVYIYIYMCVLSQLLGGSLLPFGELRGHWHPPERPPGRGVLIHGNSANCAQDALSLPGRTFSVLWTSENQLEVAEQLSRRPELNVSLCQFLVQLRRRSQDLITFDCIPRPDMALTSSLGPWVRRKHEARLA